MNNLNTLGERIAFFRKKKNLTQRELMDHLNFENLSKYEKDQREPKLETLISLSNYFNISLDFLIKGSEHLKVKTSISTEVNINSINTEDYELLNLYKECNQDNKFEIINTIKRFLSDPNYNINNPLEDLKDEELKVLKLFRELNSTDKIKIEGIIESKLIESEESKKEMSYQYLHGEESATRDGIA